MQEHTQGPSEDFGLGDFFSFFFLPGKFHLA